MLSNDTSGIPEAAAAAAAADTVILAVGTDLTWSHEEHDALSIAFTDAQAQLIAQVRRQAVCEGERVAVTDTTAWGGWGGGGLFMVWRHVKVALSCWSYWRCCCRCWSIFSGTCACSVLAGMEGCIQVVADVVSHSCTLRRRRRPRRRRR